MEVSTQHQLLVNPAKARSCEVHLNSDLLEHRWARYGLRIQELCARDHITRHDLSQPELFAPDDPLPF